MLTTRKTDPIAAAAGNGWLVAPFVLVRANNIPARDAELTDRSWSDLLDDVARLRRERDELGARLCDILFERAGRAADPAQRRAIVQLRRDIHNQRPVISHGMAAPPTELELWKQLQRAVEELATQIEKVLPAGLGAERRRLQTTVSRVAFQRSVVLSSTDLAEEARRYAAADADNMPPSMRKAELGLLHYQTRAAVRTSPFGWYTSVGMGQWGDGDLPVRVPDRRAVNVEVNHVVVRRYLDVLVRGPLRRLLSYRISGDARVRDGKLTFSALEDNAWSQPKVYRALERRGSMKSSRILEHLLARLRGGDALLYSDMVALVTDALPAAPVQQVLGFLDQLIDTGLLSAVVPVAEQSQAIIDDASAFLEKLDHPSARSAVAALREMDERTRLFRDAPPAQRGPRLIALRECWEGMFAKLGQNTPRIAPVYEDTVVEGDLVLPLSDFDDTLSQLAAVVDVLHVFDAGHRLRVLFGEEFAKRYGAGGLCQDVTELVEVASAAQMRWAMAAAGADDIDHKNPLLSGIRQTQDLIAAEYAAAARDSDGTLVIGADAWARIRRQIPRPLLRVKASYSAFVQPFHGALKASLVVNHIYQGNATFASRFLPLLEDEWRYSVIEYVRGTTPPQRLLAELAIVCGFNANLHPPYADWEIGAPARGADRFLATGELIARHDPSTGEVAVIRSRDGVQIEPLYAGLLIPFMLPRPYTPFYLLAGNSPIDPPFHEIADRTRPGHLGVREYPRVRVGDLVLSRRRWVIPSSAFPQHAFVAQRAPHESVLQLDSWRRDVGLPQRAFYKTVSFPSRPEGSDPLDHMRAQFASTRARPTFVDFHSILHQRAFAKRLAKPDVQELIVEELLPDPSDSLFCSESGERLATELVIQLDRLALGTRA